MIINKESSKTKHNNQLYYTISLHTKRSRLHHSYCYITLV